MRNRMLPVVFAFIIVALIAIGVIYTRNQAGYEATTQPVASATPLAEGATGASPTASPSPAPMPSGSPVASVTSNPNPDLTVNENGLSKATVVVNTSKGIIKFKFYPQDAPNTVHRIIELANKGFYNGLTFHRVVPGFVIQGGDPEGTGRGGSGQKLKAEFNNRRHIEGTVAMARGSDPDSADSQFYIALGTLPSLDRNYTVFGQVIDGMDVARKIQVGDKISSIVIE